MQLFLDAESRRERVREIVSSFQSQLRYNERQQLEAEDFRSIIASLRPRKKRAARWGLIATLVCIAVLGFGVFAWLVWDVETEPWRYLQIVAGVALPWGFYTKQKKSAEELDEAEWLLNLIEADQNKLAA